MCSQFAIAMPLADLTKKGQPNKVIGTESQEIAFATLKMILTSDMVLSLPDVNKKIILRSDGSETRIGAVLQQEDGETVKRPVAYINK